MNKNILIICIMLGIFISFLEGSDNDHFIGFWCVDSKNRGIDDFLIIKKIENAYLIVVADIDDNVVSKGIGKRIDKDTIVYEMWGNKYTLDWFKDKNGEWLEEYIEFRKEEYPIYERVENFSIDEIF